MTLLVASMLMLFTITSTMGAPDWTQYEQHMLGKTILLTDDYRKDKLSGAYCPPLEQTETYKVSVVDTVTPPIEGCAYIDQDKNEDFAPILHLWLGRPENGGSGNCEDKENMDHYMFDCMGKRQPITKEDADLGRWYVAIRRINSNETNHPENRCAVYETCKKNPGVLQMVISGYKWDAVGFEQCDGLLDKLNKPQPIITQGQQFWSDGSMLLLLRKYEFRLHTPTWRWIRRERDVRERDILGDLAP